MEALDCVKTVKDVPGTVLLTTAFARIDTKKYRQDFEQRRHM